MKKKFKILVNHWKFGVFYAQSLNKKKNCFIIKSFSKILQKTVIVMMRIFKNFEMKPSAAFFDAFINSCTASKLERAYFYKTFSKLILKKVHEGVDFVLLYAYCFNLAKFVFSFA